jgi:hypothetical protein
MKGSHQVPVEVASAEEVATVKLPIVKMLPISVPFHSPWHLKAVIPIVLRDLHAPFLTSSGKYYNHTFLINTYLNKV